MFRFIGILLFILFSLFGVYGCTSYVQQGQDHYQSSDRGAIALKDDWYGDSAERVVYLQQNWGPVDSTWFYFTTQGSELLPYDYFINLEQKDNNESYITPKHMAKFRYLPQKKDKYNPDGLPVGFVRNNQSVGLTCGACHTGQINYNKIAIRIDGAPSMSNVDYFLNDLEDAIQATIEKDDKFDRFAKNILGPDQDTPANRGYVKNNLKAVLKEVATYNTRNHSNTEYGFARVDAVGRIFNQVIKYTSGDDFHVSADAPVNFPFVWDAPQHDWVQWLGLTNNANIGSFGRNAGEVIGVFGKVDVVNHKSMTNKILDHGYSSSVQAQNVADYEEWMRKLQSPQWPDKIFPQVNTALAQKGKVVYENNCIYCHKPIDRSDPNRKIKAQMYGLDVIKTDSKEAYNATHDVAPTGKLQGAIMTDGVSFYPDQMPVALMLGDLVLGVVLNNLDISFQVITSAEKHGNGFDNPKKDGIYPAGAIPSLNAYKARPLNGIWATAPYLHNGSVPTLYDLLLPEDQRPQKFGVGRLEYDPKKVGFINDASASPFVYNTTLPANSNKGHSGTVTSSGLTFNYGTDISDEERWALVEYLKTL